MLPGITCQVNYLSPNPSVSWLALWETQLKCLMLVGVMVRLEMKVYAPCHQIHVEALMPI